MGPQWVKQGIPATGPVEGPGQDADGDGNIQIGGDGVVAKDVSGSIITGGNFTQIIKGVDPKEFRKGDNEPSF